MARSVYLLAAVTIAWVTTSCEGEHAARESDAGGLSLVDAAASPDAAAAAADDAGTGLAQCPSSPQPRGDVVVYETESMGAPVELYGHPARTRELEGTVVANGEGFPVEGSSLPGNGWNAAATRWIRISDDAERLWTIVSQSRGGMDFNIDTGTKVHATYYRSEGGLYRDDFGLTLRVEEQVAFYFARSGSVQPVWRPDDVHVTLGDAVCQGEDDCVSWVQYDLWVKIGGADPITIASGESVSQSGYKISNIESLSGTASSRCSDASVGGIGVLITRE